MSYSYATRTGTKRLFVAFAVEDEWARDFLKGQSLNAKSDYEYIDMSVKEPFDSAWKTKCRTRITGCDGVVAMLSSNTLTADGALWEIQCAIDEDKPLLGIFIHQHDQAKPSIMYGYPAVQWTREAVRDFIDGL